jgi:hypothetical protein
MTMTTQSYDYVNDEKLAGLPRALRQRMAQVQQERIDAGHTAKNGVTYGTLEKKEWIDDLIDWQASGRSAAGRRALEAREAALRSAGKF